jgi:hypothetical protein
MKICSVSSLKKDTLGEMLMKMVGRSLNSQWQSKEPVISGNFKRRRILNDIEE